MAIAFALVALIFYSGAGTDIYDFIHSLGILGMVVIGAFYTFGITTPTAFVIILKLMGHGNYIAVALIASLSATVVDTLLFMMVKKQLEKGAAELMKKIHRRIGRHSLIFPVIGFLLFGSPLPDEIALASMEMGEINPIRVSIIVFAAKFLVLLLTFAAVSAA